MARNTFRSQNVQSTPASDHFWKLRCRKSARRCARSTFRSQNVRNTPRSDHFWTFRARFAWQAQGIVHLVKSEQSVRAFVAFPKTMACVGHLKRICKDAFSRGRRSTKDMFMRDVRRSGRWFPDRGCILEHQICRFAKMILRGQAPALRMTWHQFFVAGAVLYRQVEWKSRKTHWYEAVSAALNFPFLEGSLAELLWFWCCQTQKLRKSRWIAELLRFVCCQLWKMKRSRRLASFLRLLSSNGEVSRRIVSFLILSTLKMKTSRRIAWFS